jgi:hypothetical protein
MGTSERLRVRVNDELVLDAGPARRSRVHTVPRSASVRPRPRSYQVLTSLLAEILMITPSRWTLTETTRKVRLPA